MNRGMFFMLDVFHPAIHQWPDPLWFQAVIHQWAKTITEEIDCSLVGMKLVVFLERELPSGFMTCSSSAIIPFLRPS